MSAPSANPKAYTFEVLYYEGSGLGELPRIVISAAGFKLAQAFVDDDTFPSFKPKLLFGQVPQLRVKDSDGKVVFEVVQSRAIVKYIATVAGLYGKTAEETATIEQYVEAVRDAADGISRPWWSGETGRKQEIPKLIESGAHVSTWSKKLDDLLAKNVSGYFVGNELTVADLALYQFVEELKVVYGDFISNYKNIESHFNKIGSIPALKAYVSDPSRVKSYYAQPDVY